MTDNLPAKPDHAARGHSKLGASGAERWMNCTGSVSLLKHLHLPESDDPDYRREGTAMHEAGAHALEQDQEAFELVGETFNRTEIDAAMANAVAVYLAAVREDMENAVRFWIERPISSPVHPDFYGSLDWGVLTPTFLGVDDLKGGVGIIVEPEDNPQCMYYAFGLIDGMEREDDISLADDFPVRIRIIQPRGFHSEGPVREWWTTVGAIKTWVHGTLVPAMEATAWDHSLNAGDWCRFCPAKLVCPLMVSLFGAAAKANVKEIVNLDDASIGLSFQHIDAVKHYIKALGDEALRRARAGHAMEEHGVKLVHQKSNRVWKDGAADLAKAKFGDACWTKPEFVGPAVLEKLGPAEKAFVHEFAYSPVGNLTVARLTDKRPAVKVVPASEVFAGAIAALPLDSDNGPD